ncbi:phosphopantetheine-binding protein [Streptomyces sp. NBC_01264]|uniref:phosphopantetheine-binding protein n=1 Tax=Streptomyces sp. NBC_01264 TaxID=2903804 RepID=UPI002259284E|nr:phosphopantetheine-binding protein [Streptomyces sp. NBC_01264]MCX4775838.1 phosphopantetheine-binding protein [Streptomyces sp. NBC_01264]
MTTSAEESSVDLIGAILIEMFEFPAEEVQGGVLMRDLVTDSLMVVELAIALHERLGIKVDEEELRALTLDEFAAVLDARRTAR